MAPISRLEVNFCRLLERCESMVSDRVSGDWRLEKYVAALEKKLTELKNINTCQPSVEMLAEYEKKVKFLKGIVEAEKLPTASEKALANQFLSPGLSSSPKHNKSKELHLQTKARYLQEMREELLDKKSDFQVFDNGDLRLRQKHEEDKENQDLDAVLRYHHSMQEKVAEEMVALAQNLKQNSLLAGHFIRKDTETLQRASQLTDQNYSRLKVETDRLEKHSKRCCNWWVLLVLGIVCITFLWMIVFMRLFPKR
ncbi:vesicle transport protein USE1 isoform X1 [Centruroides vittatus]|uniref:vesicle transport protein USE1 isoform X1 n=1 Tax=Centruroides vittatus TaxID=120091 RepID=UPI0035102C9D